MDLDFRIEVTSNIIRSFFYRKIEVGMVQSLGGTYIVVGSRIALSTI